MYSMDTMWFLIAFDRAGEYVFHYDLNRFEGEICKESTGINSRINRALLYRKRPDLESKGLSYTASSEANTEEILERWDPNYDSDVRGHGEGVPEGQGAGEVLPTGEGQVSGSVLPEQGEAGETREGEYDSVRDAGRHGGRDSSQGPSDYTITPTDALGKGGAKQKYHDNTAAIRLLKKIGDRQATPEEQ